MNGSEARASWIVCARGAVIIRVVSSPLTRLKEKPPKEKREKSRHSEENGWDPRADARSNTRGVAQMAMGVHTRKVFQTRWTFTRGFGRGEEPAAVRAV